MAARLAIWSRVVLVALALVGWTLPACAQSRLAEFAARGRRRSSSRGDPRLAPREPPILPVYADGDLLGFVYLNSDFTGAVGYSGKPIHMLVGIDTAGVPWRFKLVDHKEPIVLVGIPKSGWSMRSTSSSAKVGPIASGAGTPPRSTS